MSHYLQHIFQNLNSLFPTSYFLLITDTGFCIHVDGGGWPSYCHSPSISTTTSCESYCTNQKSCIGYTFALLHSKSFCNLYLNDSTCPSGFSVIALKNMAKTMYDLVAYSYTGYVCYGRSPSKLILSICQSILVF